MADNITLIIVIVIIVIILIAYYVYTNHISSMLNKQNFLTTNEKTFPNECYNAREYGCIGEPGIYYKLPSGKCVNAIEQIPVEGKPGIFTYRMLAPSKLFKPCTQDVKIPTVGRYVRITFDFVKVSATITKFVAYNKTVSQTPLKTNTVTSNINNGTLSNFELLKNPANTTKLYIPPFEPGRSFIGNRYIQIDVSFQGKNTVITDIVVECEESHPNTGLLVQIIYDPYIPGTLGTPLPLPKNDEEYEGIVVYQTKTKKFTI